MGKGMSTFHKDTKDKTRRFPRIHANSRDRQSTGKRIRLSKQSPLLGLGTISQHITAWSVTRDAIEDSGAVAIVSKE